MSNETGKKLDETVIHKHLSDVTAKSTAWIFLQEPGFIGFGVVQKENNAISWPPNARLPIDWERVSDLRLLGEKGEWHVWLDWKRKHQCRLLGFNEKDEWHIWLGWDGKHQGCSQKSGTQIDVLPDYHVLWGTKKVESDTPPWIKLTEERGAEIWLPLLGQVKDSEKNSDLPLRLRLKQVVDYDPEYHLAGIIDAALVGLVSHTSEDLLLPDDSLFCS